MIRPFKVLTLFLECLSYFMFSLAIHSGDCLQINLYDILAKNLQCSLLASTGSGGSITIGFASSDPCPFLLGAETVGMQHALSIPTACLVTQWLPTASTCSFLNGAPLSVRTQPMCLQGGKCHGTTLSQSQMKITG